MTHYCLETSFQTMAETSVAKNIVLNIKITAMNAVPVIQKNNQLRA